MTCGRLSRSAMGLTDDGSGFGRRERTAQLHNRRRRLRAFEGARDHPDDSEPSTVPVVILFGMERKNLTTMRRTSPAYSARRRAVRSRRSANNVARLVPSVRST